MTRGRDPHMMLTCLMHIVFFSMWAQLNLSAFSPFCPPSLPHLQTRTRKVACLGSHCMSVAESEEEFMSFNCGASAVSRTPSSLDLHCQRIGDRGYQVCPKLCISRMLINIRKENDLNVTVCELQTAICNCLRGTHMLNVLLCQGPCCPRRLFSSR